jgi:UDP-N-acetylmuramate dehydrogenase
VPGHAGGAIAMNAGGREGWIGDVVESLRILEPDGTLVQLERAAWNPGYRDGKLAGKCVVGAVLRLEPVGKLRVEEATREYLKKKNAVQPVTERSAGCVFKNPDPELSDGRSAGQLVDQAGAKGLAKGGARISPLHGNFLVNTGGATAADVWWLITEARKRVRDATGVELELEVQCWGSHDSGDLVGD